MSGIPFSSFPLANIAEIQTDFTLYAESSNGEAFRVQLDEAVAVAIPSLPASSISLAQMISTGLVASQIATVGTTAVITEETLFSHPIPANFIAADGQGIEVCFFGDFAPNANNKTLRVRINGVLYLSNNITAAPSGLPFFGSLIINRGAASSVIAASCDLKVGNIVQSGQAIAGLFDWTAVNTITITGQNAVASANEIRLYSVTVKVLR